MYDSEGNRRKLIVFSEHRDTLNYLVRKLRALLGRDDAVVSIHGGMPRDQRRKIQEAFIHDKEVLILVATDAAGEGINLQRAHLMVNYDLPWNPNRIEQRFGRVHRIGQTEVCHLWNLVAEDTREGPGVPAAASRSWRNSVRRSVIKFLTSSARPSAERAPARPADPSGQVRRAARGKSRISTIGRRCHRGRGAAPGGSTDRALVSDGHDRRRCRADPGRKWSVLRPGSSSRTSSAPSS